MASVFESWMLGKPACVLVYIWLQEKTEEKTSPPASGAPATGPAGVTKATPPGGVAKENGTKEPTPSPFGGEGLRETHSLDKRITETSECSIVPSWLQYLIVTTGGLCPHMRQYKSRHEICLGKHSG